LWSCTSGASFIRGDTRIGTSTVIPTTQSFNSNVSGVQSGPEAATRQRALSILKEELAQGRRVYLDVVPDEENAFDRDALQILVDAPGMGRVQLGFVRNSQTRCDFCGTETDRFPQSKKGQPPACARCGHSDQLVRIGLASKLAAQLREFADLRVYGEVLQITGGSQEKPSMGCNIMLRTLVDSGKGR
jgi:hypothetical protein